MIDSRQSHDELLDAAMAIHREGNLLEARRAYESLLQESPTNGAAMERLATTFAQQRDYFMALEWYGKALKANPSQAEAHTNRGNVLHLLGRFEEALEGHDRALQIRPHYAEAFNNRGVVLNDLKRLEEALASYDQALAFKPRYPTALKNRAVTLRSLKRPAEALASYDAALAIQPGDPEALNCRGHALRDLGRLEDSLASYDMAVSIHSNNATAFYNRSIILRDLMRVEEAIASCDLAIQIQPNYADAQWNKSELLILIGDYVRGWPLFEWRWRSSRYGRLFRALDKPLWLGDGPVAGRTVLVNVNGGFGDTLQFCRYVPFFLERGASVVLEAQPGLAGLLQTSFPFARVIPSGEPLPHFDVHCPIMSLPGAFALPLEQIPSRLPYLQVNEEALSKWAAKLGPARRLRIGLAWSGSTDHSNDHNRSMLLAEATPITEAAVDFHCLQKEIRPADRAALNSLPIHFWELDDFTDTAALIMQMDLVISVDTSVAHLSGALAKPVWVLLPYAPDMRWLLNREDCPWYPGVMRLFRQDASRQWAATIGQVSAELMRLAAGPA